MQHPDQCLLDQQLIYLSKKIKTLQKIEDANINILSITCVYLIGDGSGCEVITELKAKDIPVEFKVFIHNYRQQLIKERNELVTY